MSFDKIKELVVKNKAFSIFSIISVIVISLLLLSLTKISSSNNQCKKELEYCASLLENAYSKQNDRMEKIMKNLENNMEKADALYNDVINNLK